MKHATHHTEPATDVGRAHLADHKKFRDRIETAGRSFQFKKIEVERAFATALNEARRQRDAAIEALPKRPATNWQGQSFEVPGADDGTIVKAYNAAVAAANQAHSESLQRIASEHSQEIDDARREWRRSPGWMPHHE